MKSSVSNKIAFISPRYMEASAGGAEYACREFAEKLYAFKGIPTEILVTCAEDHFTWKNHHPEGAFEKNGVVVRRFPVDGRPQPQEYAEVLQKLSARKDLTSAEEDIFFNNNLNSGALYDFIRKNEKNYSLFVFMPYLFGLTVNGASIFPERSIIVPCLHNETYARLRKVRDILRSARGIICNSPPERELVLRLCRMPAEKARVGGIGINFPGPCAADEDIKKYRTAEPYIFYCGRREQGKNYDLLMEMFLEHRKQNPYPLQLVSAGSGDPNILPSQKGSVIDAGYVAEDVKAALFKNALLTCQPSTKESFSIVLLESWLQKRPVIVNSRCPVTDHWVRLCKGGFSFKNFFEFEESLNLAIKDKDLLDKMGRNGYEFTVRNFSWDKIIERLFNALIHFGYML